MYFYHTFTTEDTTQSADARPARDQMWVGIHSENRPSTLREVRDPLGENRRTLVQINRPTCRRGSGRNAAWQNASLPHGAMPSKAKTSVAAVFRLQAGMDISRCKRPWSDLAGGQDGGYGAPNEEGEGPMVGD